jgi:hypothetical protein
MEDDFYTEPIRPVISYPSGLVTTVIPQFMSQSPIHFIGTILAIGLVVGTVTRLFTGEDSEKMSGTNQRTVWKLPYWIPFIGHGYQL